MTRKPLAHGWAVLILGLLLAARAHGGAEPGVAYTDITYGAAGWSDTIAGKEGTYYFYRGLDYGSQRLIHPLRLVLNGGFGIMQISNRDNRPGKVSYATGIRNVAENLAFPAWSIGRMGFWDFVSSEVIPVSVNSGNAQYWPNYMNHLLGGGMSYRMMEEWFRYHDWRRPKLAAGATLFAYHFLNEVVENNDRRGPNPDPVADFWIFNPAGIILFSNDGVARFFSGKLHMADWSYQPVFAPDSGELQNMGQNYVVKWHLDSKGLRSIFYRWGGHAELGMSLTDYEGRCLSWGLGLVAKNLRDVDALSKTTDLATSAGLFYDRHNSLLASLQYAKTKEIRWRLNLYPGLIPAGPLRPGLFLGLSDEDRLVFGVTFGNLTHLPFGLAGARGDG